ncbi:LysR family transcriptional regulator [Marinomonas primoryensis]|jgi:DNA-binding transcriptional LysR family regulator|uniref:LysR family transcriptional regulator n=1 Tax=Marinomonas primoryensis TaxID=178399 RepID=A0A859CXS6_9GAMM|nr:LysR family transcriptional regulator [Marinomonas primoryensis]QKK80992.1 LysR family transcriptional regulator [Marinomonas primoryensis]
MDRLLSIEIFVKSVELGSFSAVAEAMNMSSQLIGKHIRFLEQSLGVKLINRTTRSQHLTDIGISFYERSKNILAEMEVVSGLVQEVRAVPTGKLRVSAPVSFGVNALASLLPEYMTMYPDIKVEMSLTNRTVDLIDEGFDVAFRVGNLSDSGLIARALRPYKLVLCAAPHYILEHPTISEPTDLLEHECLGFSHTELRTHWTFLTESGPMSVPVSGRLMVDSGEALMKAAIAGLGVMLQPLELVEKEMETGRLVEVLTNYPVPTRPMHLLYVPDRRMTPKLRSFIDFTLSHFGS